jgi:hypothetical protein
VWASLSETSFDRVCELWEDRRRTEEPPYFGWLSNDLPTYEPTTLALPADVVTDDLGLRPLILLHDGDHPLITDQRVGISYERAVELDLKHLHPD